MFLTVEVQGQKIMVSTMIPANTGEKCVYDNKIWVVDSTQGFAENFKKVLFNKTTREKVYVGGEDLKKIQLVLKYVL